MWQFFEIPHDVSPVHFPQYCEIVAPNGPKSSYQSQCVLYIELMKMKKKKLNKMKETKQQNIIIYAKIK